MNRYPTDEELARLIESLEKEELYAPRHLKEEILLKAEHLEEKEASNKKADARIAKVDVHAEKADAHVEKADARVAKAGVRVAKADVRVAKTDVRMEKADARVAKTETQVKKADAQVAKQSPSQGEKAKPVSFLSYTIKMVAGMAAAILLTFAIPLSNGSDLSYAKGPVERLEEETKARAKEQEEMLKEREKKAERDKKITGYVEQKKKNVSQGTEELFQKINCLLSGGIDDEN